MPRKPGKVPSYCLHKASGQAVVRIDSSDYYLGRYGSPESHAEYERLIAEWRARKVESALQQPSCSTTSHSALDRLTVEDVLLRYWEFAESYYSKDGQPTQELVDMKYALRPVRKLYGNTSARMFGPLALKAVRQHMIEVDNLSRGVINNRVNRIKRFWKWAVSEQLVPPSVYEGLRTVSGLRYGRTEARETEPVKPVSNVWVDVILPYLSPQVRAMVQIQRLTGMRPGEVVSMRPCDIDGSAEVWLYEPASHKNQWRGHRRLIPLGPKTQEIIKSFLSRRTDDYLFSPLEAEAWRNAKRRETRKTPITPSQASRKPSQKAKRKKRDRYDRDSYRRAIEYAIKRCNLERKKKDPDTADVPKWYPLQLRHSRATEIRKDFGIEAAQVSLGHANADVTQVYAERNLDLAIRIARKTG